MLYVGEIVLSEKCGSVKNCGKIFTEEITRGKRADFKSSGNRNLKEFGVNDLK